MEKTQTGLIHVYTGEGKGKTTAAVGLAVRAWGQGLRVLFLQFLKGGGYSGEIKALAQFAPRLRVVQSGSGRFLKDDPTPEDRALAAAGWELAQAALQGGEYDLVILDEISHALNQGLLSLPAVLAVLKAKAPGVEVVLTGRAMPPALLDLAALVTEMVPRKHPYAQGVGARRGIEY